MADVIQSYASYLFVLIFCSYGFYQEGTKDDYKANIENTTLRLVSVVFRHGDRTLDNNLKLLYPNDPYKDRDEYPNHNGELTKIGRTRAFQLGQILKKTYGHFLGDVYYPPNVYARSSAVSRSKMTLQLVLAALYPPIDSHRWHRKLNWQPVDTIYTRISQDGLLFPYNCEEYKQAYANLLRNEEVKTKINSFNGLMEELSEHVGSNITSILELYTLYHILHIHSSMDLILPDWSRDIFPHGKLGDAALFQYILYNYNSELIRLNGGLLLYKIIQDMFGVINGTLADRKINLFSAHDVNIVTALYALGIYDNSFPSFTSSVIIELREKNGAYFVRMLHYLGIPSSLTEAQIPECDALCPLEKFVRLRSSTTAARESPDCPLTIPLI